MLNIYASSQANEWDIVLRSFGASDVYYTLEYALSLRVHGDGEPLLVHFEDAQSHFCYVVMESDIADFPCFCGKMEPGTLFDWETPYGYGGPLSDGRIPVQSQRKFLAELEEYGRENGIVSQFIRFHPLLDNYDMLSLAIESRYLRDTVYIDTSSPELIISNMDAKNRNMIRKAQRNGVEIVSKPLDDYAEFALLYRDTMLRDSADEYYLFEDKYYKALGALGEGVCMFYALHEGRPISAAIMLLGNEYMHYHLSGSDYKARSLAPSNLLLYEASLWACSHGISRFHLGGGIDGEDSLFRFKKKFNKHGRLPFYVGRTVIDREAYKDLLALREKVEPEFDSENGRMIQYRMPVADMKHR